MPTAPASPRTSTPDEAIFPPRVEDLPSEPEPLAQFTEAERKTPSIRWYRTKLTPEQMKQFSSRSDLLGAAQTLGYLACFLATAGSAWYSAGHWPWYVTVLLVFTHGTVCSFMINAVHELGHGTIFRTRLWNSVFEHFFAFLGLHNHEMFTASHIRHHRYTLHPPDDLEVVLPQRRAIASFFKDGFVREPKAWIEQWQGILRIARGRFKGDWERTLFPKGAATKSARPVIRWARVLIIGHSLILIGSLASGQWILPLLLTFNQNYGGWLNWLCNNTQHIGLRDNVPDFRLCCRSFYLNPVAKFLYWHMNYHIEHHMYPATPCYRLGALHQAIKHDLPPTPNGIRAVWKEIFAIQERQVADSAYQHTPPLPSISISPHKLPVPRL